MHGQELPSSSEAEGLFAKKEQALRIEYVDKDWKIAVKGSVQQGRSEKAEDPAAVGRCSWGEALSGRMGLHYCECAQETLADMARSVFCATPPGQTQDSIRVFRAIIKGCIPVTFYRGNDRPFERHLHVRTSPFLTWPCQSIACIQVRNCDLQ